MSVSRYPEQFTEAQCCDDNGYCRRSVIVPQAGRHNGMGILSQSHVRDEPALIRNVHLTCYVKENNSQCLSLDVHSIVPIPAYHLPRIARALSVTGITLPGLSSDVIARTGPLQPESWSAYAVTCASSASSPSEKVILTLSLRRFCGT